MEKNKINIIQLIAGAFFMSVLLLIFQAVVFSPSAMAKINAPVITMIGPSLVFTKAGTPYVDAGATAADEEGNDLTESIKVTNLVNSTVVGYYKVGYRVVDKDGYYARATRYVAVYDITKPSIPTATPSAGDYSDDQLISLSSADEESGLDKIYYTIDGTLPDREKTEYVSPIKIEEDTTLKAVAYNKAGMASEIMEAQYSIIRAVSSEDDDDDDEDDNDNNKKKKKRSISSSAGSSRSYSSGNNGGGNETNNEISEEEEPNNVAEKNKSEGEVAGAETSNGGLIWWWIIGIIILLGIIAVVFGIKDEESQTR